MSIELTMSDRQYMAKILYTREHLEGKIIAKRVGVREATISKWVNEFNWKGLRDSLNIDKQETLSSMYEQLAELKEAIKSKPIGKRYPDTKQADIQVKLTASIRQLETDLGIADISAAGRKFIKHIQKSISLESVKEVAEWWNDFIQVELSNKHGR